MSHAAATFPLSGKKEVILGDLLIPARFIGDDGATVTVTAATMDVKSMEGTSTLPTGAFSEMSAKITFLIPSVRVLGMIFPNLYLPASFNYGSDKTNTDNQTGQVIFGANTCKTVDPVQVIIRNACDSDSAQDIRIPQALLAQGGEFAVKPGTPITVDVNITMLPNAEGAVIFGEGDLTKPTKYDVKQGKYVAVTKPDQS